MDTIIKKVDRDAAKNAEYAAASAAKARADLDYIAMMCDIELDDETQMGTADEQNI